MRGALVMQAMLLGMTLTLLVLWTSAEAVPAQVSCVGMTATRIGTEGDNLLIGTPEDDVIVGLGGNDTLVGLGGHDIICGGEGNDVIFGEPAHDQLDGGAGADTCMNGEGTDSCEQIIDDTTPPLLSIASPDGSTIDTTTPLITITYTDTGAGVDPSTSIVKIDGVDSQHLFAVTEAGASYVPPISGGEHRIEAGVKDRAGNLVQAVSLFTDSVFRALPQARPTSGVVPLTVTFITKAEYTDGSILRYRWDFQGDGIFDTDDPGARNYTFTYTQKGTFNAVLEVLNDKNQTATASVTITVGGNPPVATASVDPSNGAVPLTVNFIGAGSDSDGAITKYDWDVNGDGIFDFTSPTTGTTTHTYSAEGTYNALFQVTDNDGLTATARVTATTVRVGPPGSPTATIQTPSSPPTCYTPCAIFFDGTGSDPGGSITAFEWDFNGDGVFDFASASYAFTIFDTYESPGDFTAGLRVTDNSGLTGLDTVDITVTTDATVAVPSGTLRVRPPGSIENLLRVIPVTANVSSSYPGYGPERAIDGDPNTSWFTECGDAANLGKAPFYEVVFPSDVTVVQINMRGNRDEFAFGFAFFSGRFDVFDAAGSVLFSQVVDLPEPDRDIDLDIPDQAGVRAVRFTGLADESCQPGFAELEILGPITGPPSVGINTTIGGTVPVSIYMKDESGTVVRRLVTNEVRTAGTYADSWDGTDDNGTPLRQGVYYSVLEYQAGGEIKTVDPSTTSGGELYNPDWTMENGDCFDCVFVFKPFEDDFLDFEFYLPRASEVSVSIRLLYAISEVVSLLNRQPFGQGTHILKWDGTDAQGRLVVPPPGEQLLFSITAFTLPYNAIFIQLAPELSNVAAEPNFFDPSTGDFITPGNPTTKITYDLSKDATVTLEVFNTAINQLVRTVTDTSAHAGSNLIQWDGRNEAGIFVDTGNYRLALRATDTSGNQSLVHYVLVKVFY